MKPTQPEHLAQRLLQRIDAHHLPRNFIVKEPLDWEINVVVIPFGLGVRTMKISSMGTNSVWCMPQTWQEQHFRIVNHEHSFPMAHLMPFMDEGKGIELEAIWAVVREHFDLLRDPPP